MISGVAEFSSAIERRVARAGAHADTRVVSECARYLDLLATWNRRINLTSLPLDAPLQDASVDRLIVEPLLASELVSPGVSWVDLGSGGGSPALPLRIALGSARLTMVESRERKCAFLREVVRSLRLADATVLQQRFEALSALPGSDLVSVRAVRMDAPFLNVVDHLLRPGGHLLVFGSAPVHPSFELVSSRTGPDGLSATIHLLRKRV